jgi:hypothetical protein
MSLKTQTCKSKLAIQMRGRQTLIEVYTQSREDSHSCFYTSCKGLFLFPETAPPLPQSSSAAGTSSTWEEWQSIVTPVALYQKCGITWSRSKHLYSASLAREAVQTFPREVVTAEHRRRVKNTSEERIWADNQFESCEAGQNILPLCTLDSHLHTHHFVVKYTLLPVV